MFHESWKPPVICWVNTGGLTADIGVGYLIGSGVWMLVLPFRFDPKLPWWNYFGISLLCWLAKFATFPAIAPKSIIFGIFIFILASVWVFAWLFTFMFEIESVISLISAIVWSSWYTNHSYFFRFSNLWCASLNASANVLMIFAPATHLWISLSYRFFMNRNIITLFVILAGSLPIAFSVRSVKVWMYSCKVLSGLCLQCRLLAVCTSVVMGEYTSSSFLFISCWSKSLPNLFNIL